MRNVFPTGASLVAICVGLKKKTRLFRKAPSTSQVAAPIAARHAKIKTTLLWRFFIRILKLGLFGASSARELSLTANQHQHFRAQQHEGYAIRSPDVQRVTTHREKL